MRQTAKNNQREKKRIDQKKEVKDIHLNVLGVPKTNVNVNKTSPKQNQQDYHLYKISIDTSNKDKERKHRAGSTDVYQRKISQGYKQLPGYKKIVKPDDSSDDEAPFQPRSKIPNKPGTNLPRDRKRKRDEEVDDEICFTIPGEKATPLRIVGSSTRHHDESSEEPKNLKPKKHKRRQVGFADYDAVYGSSPEDSFSESDEDLPYQRDPTQIYKMENATTADPFFKDPLTINSTSPEHSSLGKTKIPPKESPLLSASKSLLYSEPEKQTPEYFKNKEIDTKLKNKPEVGQPTSKGEAPEKVKLMEQLSSNGHTGTDPTSSHDFSEARPSFDDKISNDPIGSKGKYPFYPYTNVKSSSPKETSALLGRSKEDKTPRDVDRFVPIEPRTFEKLPSIPEVQSFVEKDKGYPIKSPAQHPSAEQYIKYLPQVIKRPSKDSSTSPIPDIQKPYISVKKPSLSNPPSDNFSSEKPAFPEPLKSQESRISANPAVMKPGRKLDKKVETADAAMSPMSSVLKEGRPTKEEQNSKDKKMQPTENLFESQQTEKPTQQLVEKRSPIWKKDSLPSQSYVAENQPVQNLTESSIKNQTSPEASVRNDMKTSPKVNKEVMTEAPTDLYEKEAVSKVSQVSKISKTTSPITNASDNKTAPSKVTTNNVEDRPKKSKMAAFVSAIPKPLFRRTKSPTAAERTVEEKGLGTSPVTSFIEPSEAIENTQIPTKNNKSQPVNETMTRHEHKPAIKPYPRWLTTSSEDHNSLQQAPAKNFYDTGNEIEPSSKPQEYLPTGIRDTPSVEISNNHYDGHSSGENLNKHPDSREVPTSRPESGVPVSDKITKSSVEDDETSLKSKQDSSSTKKRVKAQEERNVLNDTNLTNDPNLKNPYVHDTNKNVLAYPGQIREKTPFAHDPYKENEELIRLLQGAPKTTDAYPKLGSKKHSSKQATDAAKEESNKKKGGYEASISTHPIEIKEKSPYNENEELLRALKDAYKSKSRDADLSDSNISDYKKGIDTDKRETSRKKSYDPEASLEQKRQTGKRVKEINNHKEHMVYVSRIPDTTYNVFYTADTSKKAKDNPGAKSGLTGPKGILIFVNKKSDNTNPLDEKMYKKGRQDNSTKPNQDAGRRGSKDTNRSRPFSGRSGVRSRTGDDKSSDRSKITNATTTSARNKDRSPKSTERSKATRDKMGRSGRSSRESFEDTGRSKTAKQTDKSRPIFGRSGVRRSRTGDDKSSDRSKITNATTTSARNINQSPKSTERSKATRGKMGRRGRSSREDFENTGRSKTAKQTDKSRPTSGRSGVRRSRTGDDKSLSSDSGRSKYATGEFSSQKTWPRNYEAGGDKKVKVERSSSGTKITETYPCGCVRIIALDPDNEIKREEIISDLCKLGSKCEISQGDDKKVKVERSPSGTKITETYPCGCIRIITSGPENEMKREEIISAFCNLGSQCEVSHPELLKNRMLIPIGGRSQERSQAKNLREFLPELEVVADGIISRRPIKPRTPLPTMKGAKLTGSLNINSNKVKGVCHFYLDPRLKKYLRNNMDKIQMFLEDD